MARCPTRLDTPGPNSPQLVLSSNPLGVPTYTRRTGGPPGNSTFLEMLATQRAGNPTYQASPEEFLDETASQISGSITESVYDRRVRELENQLKSERDRTAALEKAMKEKTKERDAIFDAAK